MDDHHNADKDGWRVKLKQRRKAIDGEQRKQAGESAAWRLAGSALWSQSDVIAVYSPLSGEFDPTPIAERAWSDNKTVCLPKVDRSVMRFYLWDKDDALEAGAFGISEPTADQEIQHIDLLVMPLVGWTLKGTRLGMGAGYYDRFLGTLPENMRPLSVGLAHEVQRVADPIERKRWDIPLDAVAPEAGWQAFSLRAKVLTRRQ